MGLRNSIGLRNTLREITNSRPVVNAGIDLSRSVGSLITLNPQLSDIDGDDLTILWSLTVPAGSNAALSSTTAVSPTFTMDIIGEYVATAVVYDGLLDSLPDSVTFTAIAVSELEAVIAGAVFRSIGPSIVHVYPGRDNLTVLQFSTVSLDDRLPDGLFDFDVNNISKVEVFAGGNMIDSDSENVYWTGDILKMELDELHIGNSDEQLTIAIYVENSSEGIVILADNINYSNILCKFH